MQKTKVQSAREAIGSLNALDDPSAGNNSPDPGWRLTHLGRRLGHALRRFDERVLSLMASNVEVPLTLSNLAARDQVGAAHIHITR
ncbi:MAG: hypothetical protein WAW46_10180, partial [Polaromonas sp.]